MDQGAGVRVRLPLFTAASSLAIAHFVDACERPGPVLLTHRDIQPWNLLARDGRPVVLDWKLSGMLDLSG
jgi:aminoglycoside phosphotransferase (APT) family kinase protein